VAAAFWAPAEGSYREADARGLFWAMTPAAKDAPLPTLDAARAGEVVLQLLSGGKPVTEQRPSFRRASP
jgi:hypothetical protein